jgi:DNA modification methylase
METVETTGIRHEMSKSGISLDKIYQADFQKAGTLTAQIRQTVTTKSFYPSKKVSTNLQANIFDTKDFGFAEQEFTSFENRVAWLPIPAALANKPEEVKAKLEAAYKNGGCIYRVLANSPILTDDQKYSITQGLKTKDDFANTQAVRTPENETTLADGTAGKLTLDKAGNVQYRRTFFWLTKMDDQDARDVNDVYLSPELQAELAGASVMQGQTIN